MQLYVAYGGIVKLLLQLAIVQGRRERMVGKEASILRRCHLGVLLVCLQLCHFVALLFFHHQLGEFAL